LRAELDPLARHPHVIAMDIDDLAHSLENAFTHAYPGHEAAERDATVRELQRLLERPRRPAAHRSDCASSATSHPLRGASGSSLVNALRLL
jgi:hypothetical protein